MRRKSVTSEMMRFYISRGLLALMERQDFASITVTQIAARAGVNRSTYYRHFTCKEDVVRYFLTEILQEFLDWSRSHPQAFDTYLVSLYTHYQRYRREMLSIYQNGLSLLFLEVLRQQFTANVGTDDSDREQYKVFYHIGGTFHQFLLWFSRGMADAPKDMARYTLAVLPAEYVPYVMPK